MPRPTANQKAFTLIEVLMAATVLVVSFTAVIQAVTTGADMIDTARKQQIAQQIIDGEIAYQRASSWAGIGLVAGIADMLSSTYRIKVNADGTSATDDTADIFNDLAHFSLDSNPPLMAMAKGFTCQAETINIRPYGQPPLLAITYTVTWTSSLGRTHTRTGVGYFAQNGLYLSYQK